MVCCLVTNVLRKMRLDNIKMQKSLLSFLTQVCLVRYMLTEGTCVFTDIIDELVKSGKEIEAVYFAFESGLTERFSPVSLLKSYLHNSRKNATTILKNGNHSSAAAVCFASSSYLNTPSSYLPQFPISFFSTDLLSALANVSRKSLGTSS